MVVVREVFTYIVVVVTVAECAFLANNLPVLVTIFFLKAPPAVQIIPISARQRRTELAHLAEVQRRGGVVRVWVRGRRQQAPRPQPSPRTCTSTGARVEGTSAVTPAVVEIAPRLRSLARLCSRSGDRAPQAAHRGRSGTVARDGSNASGHSRVDKPFERDQRCEREAARAVQRDGFVGVFHRLPSALKGKHAKLSAAEAAVVLALRMGGPGTGDGRGACVRDAFAGDFARAAAVAG